MITRDEFTWKILTPIRIKVTVRELDVLCEVLKKVLKETPLTASDNKSRVYTAYKLLYRMEGRRFTTKKELSLSMNIAEAAVLAAGLQMSYGLDPMVAGIHIKIDNQL